MSIFMKNRAPSPMSVSMRSKVLLREFGSHGEQLELDSELCKLEFPDADPSGRVQAGKYKRFVVHYSPRCGLYAGGCFRIEFDVNKVPDYPMKPPKCRMLTKVWHPNVDLKTGAICHNYLKADAAFGDGCGYSAAFGMQVLVNAILTMFDYESAHVHSDSWNVDDPLNLEAASQWKRDPSTHEAQARQWVKEHAKSVVIKPHCLAFGAAR